MATETMASSVPALARMGVNGNERDRHEYTGGEKLPHLLPRILESPNDLPKAYYRSLEGLA